ncbi:MAG: hypothetical protein IPO35_03550 [Uliginosibacterium sp.]|jgi:hypothetical protein|nr:hypothetical protein [Uliginosibacterium sp.]
MRGFLSLLQSVGRVIEAMRVMSFRVICAGAHLAASALLIGTVVLLLSLFGGYEWPLWYIQGSERIFGLLIFVDLCLGPLITLIVSDAKKPVRSLRRDWSIVAAIQVAALCYGSISLWQGRPVALVAAVDRLEVVSASQYSGLTEDSLKGKCAEAAKLKLAPGLRVCWAAARIPKDREKGQALLFSSLSGGPDLAELPEHYVSADEVLAEYHSLLKTVEQAEKLAPFLRNNKKIQSFGALADIRLIWIQGKERAAAIVVSKEDSAYLGIVTE